MALPQNIPPDLVFLNDLDGLASQTSSDFQGLAQDIYHLFLEDLGSNPDDPTRGIGINNYLNGTSAQLAQLPGIAEAQLNADPGGRITGAKVYLHEAGSLWTIQVQISVSGAVIGLQYSYSNPAGLSFLGFQGV
jgi:hypothetical protein